MLETTKKNICSYLHTHNNLNTFTDEQIKELNLQLIAMSFGVYGMNGALFMSRTDNEFYVIPTRSTKLFKFV